MIFTSRPYRHGHGDDSLCRCIDLDFPFPQPRRARTQACRSSASVGRSAPTTPRFDLSSHPWIGFYGCCSTGSGPRSSTRWLSLPKIRFEHSGGVVRQGLDTRQCRRTVRRAVRRAHPYRAKRGSEPGFCSRRGDSLLDRYAARNVQPHGRDLSFPKIISARSSGAIRIRLV